MIKLYQNFKAKDFIVLNVAYTILKKYLLK